MAVRKNESDQKIRTAAMQEFLKYGYRDASLRRIAQNADTTTGSIYMRYQNKDALFSSLVAVIPAETKKAFETLKPVYYAAENANDMMLAVQKEADTVMHILFDHHEEAVLLLCKSEGSSSAGFLDQLTQLKIQESEAFFHGFKQSESMKQAFEILISSQFQLYRQILEKGMNRKQAEDCMQILTVFLEAGWNSIMQELIKEKRDSR